MAFSWSAETVPAASAFVDVAHNGSVFCAIVGSGALAYTSPDGVTWTSRTLPSSQFWTSIAWNGTAFCAVAGGDDVAATSPDGITWTARALPSVQSWNYICAGGSRFCVLTDAGGAGTTAAATSVDNGATWTARTLPATHEWSGLAWNGSVFCAITYGAAVGATSPDGITWTLRTLSATDDWLPIAWNGSLFVVLSNSTDAYMTSPDGVTWTSRTLPTTSTGWAAIAACGPRLCAVPWDTGTLSIESDDGLTWTQPVLPASTDWATVGSDGSSKFVALSSSSTDAALGRVPALLDLSDGLVTQSTTTNNLAVSLAEALTVTGAWTPDVLANLIERLHVAASTNLTAVLQGTASDRVSFLDSVQTAWQVLLTGNIATTGDALGTVHKLAAIVDALAATGQANGQLTALAACTSALALEGLMRNGFTANLLDSTTLTEATTSVARLLGPLVDGLQVSASGTPMLRLSCVSRDGLTLADDPAALLRANADASDGILFYVSLRIGDTDYSGWVLNTTNQAASEYRGLQLDSFASFKGKHYGAGPGGIVQFTGDSDDGTDIDAWLRTTLTHFGTGKHKRVPDAYIGATADGRMLLKTITRNPLTGDQFVDFYEVTRKQATGPGQGRVQIGRGLVSTWWSMEIANVAGSDFAIDSIELRPLVLDRRV